MPKKPEGNAAITTDSFVVRTEASSSRQIANVIRGCAMLAMPTPNIVLRLSRKCRSESTKPVTKSAKPPAGCYCNNWQGPLDERYQGPNSRGQYNRLRHCMS